MAQSFSLLVATYDDGIVNVTGTTGVRELAGHTVSSLSADGRGGVLAIIDGRSVRRRTSAGEWIDVATSEVELACCVAIGDVVFAGTTGARILRIGPSETGEFLSAFDSVAGRDTWYPGGTIVDGTRVGPPLGIRTMDATSGGALLANVHVGGIPRSADAGRTWQPTIAVESDVHQVRAHPVRADIAIAAAAAGLCVSRDGGVTWAIVHEGLHARHCSAVAIGRNDFFISASTDPFASEGAVYRRPIDGNGALEALAGGLPRRTAGIVDTGCIATRDAMVAFVDASGALYVSEDDGASWRHAFDLNAYPSGLEFA